MSDKNVSLGYVLAVFFAVLATWSVHEFAHWLTSEMLGYEAIMRINSVSPINREAQLPMHSMFISAAGPMITLLQALIIFLLLKSRGWNKYIYPFLFTAFYMRLLAGFMNIINLNDEGRISEFLGIGTFTLPIFVSGIIFLMVYLISKKYTLGWNFQLFTTLFIMLFSSILILSDQFIGIRVI